MSKFRQIHCSTIRAAKNRIIKQVILEKVVTAKKKPKKTTSRQQKLHKIPSTAPANVGEFNDRQESQVIDGLIYDHYLHTIEFDGQSKPISSTYFRALIFIENCGGECEVEDVLARCWRKDITRDSARHFASAISTYFLDLRVAGDFVIDGESFVVVKREKK
jgi:hypothetical protein